MWHGLGTDLERLLLFCVLACWLAGEQREASNERTNAGNASAPAAPSTSFSILSLFARFGDLPPVCTDHFTITSILSLRTD